MVKNLLKVFFALTLILKGSVSFSQNFTSNWTFATDSLSAVTGNITASGAIINPTLFTKLRSYGPAGLKGMGTNGKATTPACNALYNSAGATTPIAPFMEMSMSPNAGYSASVNAFSFSVKGDSLSSASMVIAAGYSTDGGVSFTGFNITKNGALISPAPGTTGTSIATGDSLVFSAPSLNVASASSLIIRIIYWKNASSSTSGNRIIISSVLLTGTTTGSVSNTPTISAPNPSTLSGLTYVVGSGPSAQQSFSVSATNLTSSISVAAPTNFEISTTSGSGFGASATITPTSGAVNAAMVYVRLKSGLSVNTYNGNVSLTSTGATAQTVACTGSVTNPAPIVTSSTPSNITGFSYGFGNGPSASQSFTVSGQYLTDTLKVGLTTANFEISLSPTSGYVSNAASTGTPTPLIKIAPVAGVVTPTLIYARLKAGLNASSSAYLSKKVTISSTGATSLIDTLNGVVFNPTISANPNNLTGFNYTVGSGPSTAQSFSVSAKVSVPVGIKAPASYQVSLSNATGYADSLTLSPVSDSVAPTTVFVKLKAGLSAGNYNDSVIISSNAATSQSILCNGSVNALPVPTISSPSVTSLSGFSYLQGSGPSAEQSFTVSGTNLTTGITVSASTNYEVSTTSGTGFGASVTLPANAGNVNAAFVYVRLKSGLSVANYNGETITIASTGATSQYVTCNGSVVAPSTPIISLPAPASLTGFGYLLGSGPSAFQSFSFSASNLTTNLIVTASSSYEVSQTSGSGYSNSVSLTPTSGSITSTTIYVRMKSGLTSNTYNENISITSTGAATQSVSCSGTVTPPPTPVISSPIPASLTGFTYLLGSGPSAFQSFSISASNLTSNLIVTASSSYEVSQTSGSGYSNSVSLTPTSGSIASTTIYVRMKSGLTSNTYNESISITSTGATAQSVSCSGTVTPPPTPVIGSPTPTSLSGFSYALGSGPSVERSFTVSGNNLTTNITVTAPSSYQVSVASGSGFSDSVTLTPVAGVVSSTTVYVRMISGLVAGVYNENISISSAGSVTQSLACSGTVNDPGALPNMTAVWPFVTDTLATTTGNVTAPGAYINPILFRISRTYGPNGLTGTGTSGLASAMCNATFDSILTISPYMEMSLAPNSSYSATLNPFSFKIKANTISSTSMYIAAGYSADGGTTFTGFSISRNGLPDTVQGMNGVHLWSNDSLVLSAPALSIAAGSSLKMRIIYWKNNNSNTTTNPITIGSVSVTGNTQLVTSSPIISSPVPSSLSGLTYVIGNGPSTEHSFVVSGMNLTNDITVTAPTNYEVSATSGNGFGSSVVLTATAGTVSNSTVYVRLKAGLSVASYNEIITISSNGATAQTVACSGSVTNIPSPAITSPAPSALSGFNYVLGSGPSSEHSFVIAGQYLTNDITITAPSSYEISTVSGSGFSNSVTLTPVTGAVSNTTIYVRMIAGLVAGGYNESIDISSTGAIAQSVTCSGTVNDPGALPNMTAVWPFVTDTLATTTGNVSAPGAYINPILFRTSRTYGPNGLTGTGTSGLASPMCNATFDSILTISPYMEMSLAPNSGYSATLNPFSFKIKANTISSTSMYIAAGYSADGGTTFTGFSISRNGLPDTVQGMNGVHLWSNDSLVLSAPALSIAAGSSLKMRIIYWKNNNSNTTANPITIGSVNVTGNTQLATTSPFITTPIPSSLSGFTYVLGAGPSTEQHFTVSGLNLTNDITVTAPANYEVSTTSGSGFGTSVVLPATAGTVSSTMVYVRLKAGLSVAAYNENVTLTSIGANTQSVACTGNVVANPVPTINMPSPMNLSGFSYVVGAGPSTEHSFTIGGQYLTNDITVTAPTNYEVSTTSGSGFGASVVLTATAGTVSSTMVYVRLKAGLTVGSYNETIDITSTDAMAQTVTCAGTVTDQTTTPDVTAVWPFVTDTLATTTGNITAQGAYIDQTLFRTSRTYGPNGLTGAGTTGIASPTCNELFDSVGSVITPYMEMSLAPNAGYSASLNPFSFKITAGTITSTSMYIAAGYSEDGGLTFTGFNISRNGLPDSVQGVNGIHLWSNDSLRLSAPALSIASGSSLKIRIIYWKNSNTNTSSNPITIGSVAITGTTAVDCSSINASISGKSIVANTNSNDAVFTIAGTSGAEVTYNINGGTNTTTTLNQGTSTITINNVTSDQTIRLVSVTKGSCSKLLNSSATVNVPSAIASFTKGYTVYPNPVTQGNVNIMFQDIAQGNYLLRLFNSVGQVLISKEISHPGGNVLQTINFGKQFADGCYLIEIRNMSTGKKTVKQVIFTNQ